METNKERFEYLKTIRTQPSKIDIHDNFYNGLKIEQQNQQILLSKESRRNIFEYQGWNENEGRMKQQQLNDINLLKQQQINEDLMEIMYCLQPMNKDNHCSPK